MMAGNTDPGSSISPCPARLPSSLPTLDVPLPAVGVDNTVDQQTCDPSTCSDKGDSRAIPRDVMGTTLSRAVNTAARGSVNSPRSTTAATSGKHQPDIHSYLKGRPGNVNKTPTLREASSRMLRSGPKGPKAAT